MNTYATGRRAALAVTALLGVAVTARPAAAQTMKPGLWEIQNKMAGGGDQGAKMAAAMEKMHQQMASMPPEQRKMMQDMMAKQGLQMNPDAGVGMSTRICITKEMAARNEAPAQDQGDCKRETLQRSGNTTRFKFTCANPPSSGEGTITVNDPESYTMNMKVTGGRQRGTMTMDAQGKWLGSDCGSVKPITG